MSKNSKYTFISVGVEHRITSAYTQTNGLTARFKRTLKEGTCQMIRDSNDDWDVKIPAILFSYRTAIHSSTTFTPFFLLYNREPRLALDLQLKQSHESTDGIHQDVTQEQLLHDVEVLVNLNQRYTTIAKQNIVKAQQRLETNYMTRGTTRL